MTGLDDDYMSPEEVKERQYPTYGRIEMRVDFKGPIFMQTGEDPNCTNRPVLHSCKGEPMRVLGEGVPDCEIRMGEKKGKATYKCLRCGAEVDVYVDLRIGRPNAE
jgi:hypothetical protein